MAKSALIFIEVRCILPFSVNEVFNLYDPGSMLDTGIQYRAIFATKREYIGPSRIGVPGTSPRGQVASRHRSRYGIALRYVAAKPEKHQTVLHRLHSLRNDLATEGFGEAKHSFQDSQVLSILEQVPTAVPDPTLRDAHSATDFGSWFVWA